MKKVDLRKVAPRDKAYYTKQILPAHAKGESITSLSKKTGVHRATISRWVNTPKNGRIYVTPGKKKEFNKLQVDYLLRKLIVEVATRRLSPIWTLHDVQLFFKENNQLDISLYHTRNFVSELLNLPDKSIIKKCFEKPYNALKGMTPAEYAKKYKRRCYYLLETKRILGTSKYSTLRIILSPRGDIRFTYLVYTGIFRHLLRNSKKELILVYFKGLFDKDNIAEYSKEFPTITFVKNS